MATSKEILASDKKTTRSFLNQLIDVLQEDVSSSISRRKYQVFVTGGVGPGVTSSFFQTVYDQDFTLQTANPIFDITIGLAPPDAIKGSNATNDDGVAGITTTGQDTTGKYLYPSSSLMMREKTDIYSQFAQTLLGSRTSMFKIPVDATLTTTQSQTDIDSALFIAFKRLFARDQIKRETFAMRFYTKASFVRVNAASTADIDVPQYQIDANGVPNLYAPSLSGSAIFTDIGASDSRYFDVGGQYGYLVDASSTTNAVGLLYYDSGIAILDVSKITSGSQFMSGAIDAMSPTGQIILGGDDTETQPGPHGASPNTGRGAKLIPDLMTSGSVDNIIDHFCYTRFGAGSLTAITFQNVTNINSSLIFCRALPDDFNYSSNPTYIEQTGDFQGRLTIYDPALPEEQQEPFTYITTIGLYDNSGGMLAVAKLSRPIEKNPGRDLTLRCRLDFAKKHTISYTK
jgi:hypothetical protein